MEALGNHQMIFVSHANPEENEFARWLTLQLANEGYAVWCDQTKLLGGEKFWEDIQAAIQNHTSKFLFVLTTAANAKRGTLDELDCAIGTEKRKGLKDFIIPLKLDGLSYDNTYISIRRLNQIDFRKSWALGLDNLIEKLKRDSTPKSPNFNPEAVALWWRSQQELSAEQGILNASDIHYSNWFGIQGLPETINRHFVARREIGKIEFDVQRLSYPAIRDSDISFLSFAPAAEFSNDLPGGHFISDTDSSVTVADILTRSAPKGFSNCLTQLLREACERAIRRRGLASYELSNRARCFYFQHGTVPDNRLFFQGVSGKRERRDVVGYATVGNGRKRYWHYGINAKPVLSPFPHFVIKGHVLFSDDARSIWPNKEKIAKARRSQCKTWWNDEWRDRILATMSHIAGVDERIEMPIAPEVSLNLARYPEQFESSVSYIDPQESVKEDLDDYDFEESDPEDEAEETETLS